MNGQVVLTYNIETPQGEVLCGGYTSLGHCLASASKYAIDADLAEAKDVDGKTLVDRLIVKDSNGKQIREVTKNYPAH